MSFFQWITNKLILLISVNNYINFPLGATKDLIFSRAATKSNIKHALVAESPQNGRLFPVRRSGQPAGIRSLIQSANQRNSS